MLPATCPPDRMVRFVLESSPSILAHLAVNAALSAGSLAVNAAIRLAAGSRCCSKKIGRSPSVTSRSRTSLVMRHSRQTLDAISNVILPNDPRRRTPAAQPPPKAVGCSGLLGGIHGKLGHLTGRARLRLVVGSLEL